MIDEEVRQQGKKGEWSGRTVGGYRIDSVIGQGGMATVYRAYQEQLERWVAIKVLKQTDMQERSFLNSFRQEARAIAALRHPNILTVYDYGEEEGTPYIVMEYVAGGTLKTFIGDEPRPWVEVADLTIPVARALAYAHSQGIIHCDVKPSNILLSRSDWPLLADFGLIRLQGQETVRPTGTLSGTPTYASPEQIMGQNLTGASDVYSLGLVLYQLLTGRLPFSNIPAGSAVLQRLLEYPAPPSVHTTINAELERIVLKALARLPAERYQDMSEFVSELEKLPGSSQVRSPEANTARLTRANSTQALSEQPLTEEPHLVVTGTGTILTLPAQKTIVLGRGGGNDDNPPDVDLSPHGAIQAGVSRRHARLRYAAEGWLLEDLGSTNGTSLNIVPVKEGELYRIRTGDVIRCGRLMLVFFDK